MRCLNLLTMSLLIVGLAVSGCAKSSEKKSAATDSKGSASAPHAAEHTHGAGPNGGVVFELGGSHAEFTVDHAKQQCMIVVLGNNEKTPTPVAATEFVLSTKETKTADGKVVPSMTITMKPVDAKDGKAMKFIGTDPGLANVADFAGTVSGEIDSKPAMGEFKE